MRRTVTITPEPRPYTCTIRVCDLCGKERPGEYLDDGGGLYDRPEVTIECRFGADSCRPSKPRSGSGSTETANLAKP